MTYYHTQVDLHGIMVDKGMVPILSELWRMGFLTLMSCEDNVPEGYAWIMFGSRAEGLAFVRILADVLPRSHDHEDVRIRFLGSRYKTCCVRFPNRYLKKITGHLKTLD